MAYGDGVLDPVMRRAKYDLWQGMKAGADPLCPCCTQQCVIRHRKLDAHHALALGFMIYLFEQNPIPIHYDDLVYPFGRKDKITINHFSVTTYFGLTIPIKKDDQYYHLVQDIIRGDPEKPSSGYYLPTIRGVEFVYNRLAVQKYRDRFNSQTIRTWGEDVKIEDLNNEWFDWAEMNGKML
jgi:hypothetical protein